MRTLARGLLADPQAADEVVQDAWVVALRRASTVRTDPVAWLRTVVRNLALRRGTREGRRRSVEEAGARPEALPDAREAVERMELQRWLADALLALEEPLRSAVILRHVEGLDPGTIAARQGCSPEAARQRISRGLARLRAALDARPGGRGAWALLLAPCLEAPPSPLPVPWTLGGMLVSTKAVLASLVAVAAVAAVWIGLERSPHPRSTPAEPGSEATHAVLTLADGAGPEAAPRPERQALPAPEVAAAPTPDAPPSDPLLGQLVGRVVDAERAPIAGATVVLHRRVVGGFSVLDLKTSRAPRELARATTGADGRFAFTLERGIPHTLGATAPGADDEHLPECYAGQELEVVLGPGYRVRGRVTRARDGAPVADARVRVFRMGGKSGDRSTRTAADGSYEVAFTDPVSAYLEVTPEVEMGSSWIAVEPGPDRSAHIDVVVEDGLIVTGRVTELESGAPLAGAEVGEGWTFRRSAFTDADGTYRLPGFGIDGVQELYARAPDHGPGQCARLPAAVDGVMRVDFALPRGRVARGRVLDAEHRPLADAYVAAVASEFLGEGQSTDWVSGRTDAAGRFELRGLAPALRHALLASCDGHATCVWDFPPEELEQPELELGALELARAGVVSGLVVDESGTPLPGMEVVLVGTNADRARLRGDAELALAGDWYVNTRTARADAGGRFTFGALPAGSFRLHARASGRPKGPPLELQLAQGETREGVELLYPAGETITGTVVDAEGRGIGGVYVNASLVAARGGSGGAPGTTVSFRTGGSGSFELTGLVPGAYDLDLWPFDAADEPDAPWLPARREAVESGGPALRVELPRGVTIRGTLVDADGAALVGHIVLAEGIGPFEDASASTATDDQGRFVLAVPRGAVFDLEVRGAPQTDAWDTVFLRETGIAAGDPDVRLRLSR